MRQRVDRAEVGVWNALCDRCGWKFKNYELRETWDGYYVCNECWEPRHPQDFVRGVADNPSVPWTRPDYNPDDGITYVGDSDTTLDSASDTIQVFDVDLTTSRIVTLSTSFDFKDRGKRFHIYRYDDGLFDLHVGNVTTLSSDKAREAIVEWNGSKWQLITVRHIGVPE